MGLSNGDIITLSSYDSIITITNKSEELVAQSVTVTFTFPAAISVNSENVSQGSYAANVWTVGNINTLSAATIDFNFLVNDSTAFDGAGVTFTYVISSSTPTDNITSNNSGSRNLRAASCESIGSCIVYENKSFVNKGGNDSTFLPHSITSQALTPIYPAKDVSFTSGDLIQVAPGTYAWGTDVLAGGSYRDTQLANDGEIVSYYLEDGVIFTSTSAFDDPFGAGQFGDDVGAGTVLNIDGKGDIRGTSAAGVDVVLPLYGKDGEATIKLKRLETTGGDSWGIQSSFAYLDLEIDELLVDGLGISIAPSDDTTDSYSYVKVKKVSSKSTNTRGGLFRFQPGTDSDTATNTVVSIFDIGDIYIPSGSSGTALYQQSNNAGVNTHVIFNVDNIVDEDDPGVTVAQFTGSSNDAGPADGNIVFSGGQFKPWIDSTFTYNVNSIKGISPAVSVQGNMYNNSNVNINVKYGYSRDYYAIGFFDPHIEEGSTMVFDGGHYVSDSTEHACLMINNVDIPAAVQATGDVTLTQNPSDGDTYTIGSVVYTFQATFVDSGTNVHIGATASDSLDNLISAITGVATGSAVAGTDFPTGVVVNTEVDAAQGTGDSIDFTALPIGASGNSITMSTDITGATITQMNGGVNGGKLVFRNARFESRGLGQAAVAIGSGVSADIDQIMFYNCEFINDGIEAPLVTNNGGNIDVKMINCSANSTVALTNITDVLSGLTTNVNII